ncbi:MAG: HVO_2523 family zinc finger protein [Halodesulfurarchaeum sp.]
MRGSVPAVPTTGPVCPACDRALSRRHCKYVCPNHGVVFDCSDPFR